MRSFRTSARHSGYPYTNDHKFLLRKISNFGIPLHINTCYNKNMMSDQKPEKLNFGQAVVFNPFLLHGNTVFNSDLARIACTTRFQSSTKPLLQKNSDYLKFYSLN